MITLVNQNKAPPPCCVFFDLERAPVRAQNMIRSQQAQSVIFLGLNFVTISEHF